MPVDFEAGGSWWELLAAAGFDAKQRTVVASTGVSMYLTKETIVDTLRQIATLAPASTLAMTFMLTMEMIDPDERPQLQRVHSAARAAGTPFVSFFRPPEMLALAREAGFKECRHVSTADLTRRYFSARTDGLAPARGEEFLVAST